MSAPVRRAWALGIALLAIVIGVASASDKPKRAFTVQESIAWSSVINFTGDPSANPRAGSALFSPAGSRFVVHMRRGSLEQNAIVDTLLSYETDAVRRYLASKRGDHPPAGRVLAQLAARREAGTISRVQWLSEHEVGFLADGPTNTKQAFVVDLTTGATSQVTRSPTPVVSFSFGGNRMLFLAHAPQQERLSMGVVGADPIGEIMTAPAPDSTPLELFSADRSGNEPLRIGVPAMNLFEPFHGLWVSPSGAYGIAFAPATNAPAHWADYQIPEYESYGYTAARVSADPTSMDLLFRSRYLLIDLRTGDARPLLDAPSGWLAQNQTPIEVFWPQDEKSVIVTNAYLPLTVEDAAIRAERAARPAIAEVNLTSGEISPIFWEPVLTDEERKRTGGRMPWRITAVECSLNCQAFTVTKRIRAGEQIDFRTETLRKVGSSWQSSARRRADAELAIDLRQSLTQRPMIYASRAGVRKVLLDPNPQAEQLTFGRVEVVRWSVSPGEVPWQGGLVYPPGYVAGQRYPLVVQTHGFDAEQFLVDGPGPYGSTAMAAQALANAGFLVLQIEDKPVPNPEQEGQMMAAGYYGGIQHLIERGLADPQRLGLIAFSRTGFYALHLLAEHPRLLKAVTIADSVQIGYVTQVLMTNLPGELINQMHVMSGGPPSVENVGEWFARNPTYKLPKTRAAVRLESNDALGSVLGLWETYALLRNANRPVEFVYFPDGTHVQSRPAERLGSQGGNVDWFRFWLLDQESDDSSKASQYQRWRQLRALQ
jgi:hypothetical protein